MRKSSGVPARITRSASPSAVFRDRLKNSGCDMGISPLAIPLVKQGNPVCSQNPVSAAPASDHFTPVPAMTMGFSAPPISSAARSSSSSGAVVRTR